MSISIILALIAIGAACFGGYIYLSASSSSKPNSAAISTEAQEELALVSKMKQNQLIKDSKKIQDLVKKNQIFKRSYENVIGKEDSLSNDLQIDNSNYQPEREPTNQEEVFPDYDYDYGMNDSFVDEEEFAARSFEEEITTDQIIDNGVLSEAELSEISALGEEIKNINTININSEVEIDEKPQIDYSQQSLEDDYTEEQEWLIKHVYNTFISSKIR